MICESFEKQNVAFPAHQHFGVSRTVTTQEHTSLVKPPHIFWNFLWTTWSFYKEKCHPDTEGHMREKYTLPPSYCGIVSFLTFGTKSLLQESHFCAFNRFPIVTSLISSTLTHCTEFYFPPIIFPLKSGPLILTFAYAPTRNKCMYFLILLNIIKMVLAWINEQTAKQNMSEGKKDCKS